MCGRILQAGQQACLGPTARSGAACCPASCAHNSMCSPVSGSSSGSTANFLKNSMASSLWACTAQRWHQVSLLGYFYHPSAEGLRCCSPNSPRHPGCGRARKRGGANAMAAGLPPAGLGMGQHAVLATWHAPATGAAQQQRTHTPTPFGLPCRRSGWPRGKDGTPEHQCRTAAPPPPGSRQRLRSNRRRASGQGDWLLEVASTAG